jgi:predicted RNA-binding Zn-ribbon protein involved in translation (DUF1610 family)
MKCSNCGKEFGNGVNCQHCGVDRVAGLANYSGYDGHAGSNSYDSSSYGEQTSPKTTVCYACSEIIPLGATFCPVCGKKLLVTCPKCGHEYSSQYPVCSECGTNREEYNERKRREEEKRKAWEQSPKGKAEIEQKRKEQEKKEEKSMVLSQIIFWVGGFVLMFLLDSMIDKNLFNYDLLGLNIRLVLIMCISFGASLLTAVVIDNIISEE